MMIGRIGYMLMTGLLLYACTHKNFASKDSLTEAAMGWDSVIVVPADFAYPADSTFKILSWNVEHFVDPYDDPYIDNERENDPPANMPLRVHLLLQALRRGERNTAMRKGQINLLVSQFDRILAENPDKNMVVAGDLNATPGSEEMDLLLDNNQLSTEFIDLIDTTVYSHPPDDPTRRLDHLLVNENMYPEAIKDSLRVSSFFSSDTMRIISDHLPVTGLFYKEESARKMNP